ncbi:MAG: YihY/virulence factor BrkB family protein [Myxococcota bacterium]|nr:YihY/virulence factor BrkB family protein [Myxococcota bacterium]
MLGGSQRWRRAVPWLKSIAAGVENARTFGLAAEMSFWLFLALVPLAAVAGLVAARIAVSDRSAALWSLLASVPASARGLIALQVEEVASWKRGTVAPVAVLTFVWLASSGVHAVIDAIEVQSGTSRSWWKKRLIAIGACVALSLGVALVALLAAGFTAVQTLAGSAVPPALVHAEQGPAGQVVRWLAGLLIAVGLTAGLYRVGIPRGARARGIAVLPGATFSVGLQAALGWGYGVYVAALGSGGAYQASLAVVGVTMMTLWLFSLALLLGVQLNRVVSEARVQQAPRVDPLQAEGLLRCDEWPRSAASSSQPISARAPNEHSTGP